MKLTAKEIALIANNLKIPAEKLERQIVNYVRQKCKEQMQKCRNIYSVNRHKSSQDIKEGIRK